MLLIWLQVREGLGLALCHQHKSARFVLSLHSAKKVPVKRLHEQGFLLTDKNPESIFLLLILLTVGAHQARPSRD